jgi:hypothetical protein
MERRVADILFTDKETLIYSQEFDQQTKDQRKPLPERVRPTQQMMGHTANVYFNKLFRRSISNDDMAIIWELASEGQAFLKLPNFMACMRLFSAARRGDRIDRRLMYKGNS